MPRQRIDNPSVARTKTEPGYFSNDTANRKRHYGVYVGIVKNTQDVTMMGRLDVFLPEFGGVEDNRLTWKTVNYCAPFGGSTPGMERYWEEGINEYDYTPTSYGFWAVPPDVGNKVLVMFINGNEANGIWIGVLYDTFMNYNVPGLAAYDKHDACDYYPNVPTTEYNKFDPAIGKKPIDPDLRPYHKRQYERMWQNQQLEDPYRGWTTSSAQRETPSAVYGMSTPGPIDMEADDVKHTFKRAGGHQFVMDDGDINGDNRLIRLRARGGAQLLLHDTLGFVYICNKMGTAWVELDRDGNIEVFSNNTINLRANEDINIRADRDLNIDVGRNIVCELLNDYLPNEAKQEQKDIKKEFKYTKICGIEQPVPPGSIYYHLGPDAGNIEGLIEKGDVVQHLIKGNVDERLDEGNFRRTLIKGDFHSITGGSAMYSTEKTEDHHAKVNIQLEADNEVATSGGIANKVYSAGNVHIKADDSLLQAAKKEIDLVAPVIKLCGAVFMASGGCVSPDTPIKIKQPLPADPVPPPNVKEYNDVVKIVECAPAECLVVERIVSRYPGMEPWGGIKGPGQGANYHIDVKTVGCNDLKIGAEVPPPEIPVTDIEECCRPGGNPHDVVSVRPAPVDIPVDSRLFENK